MLRVKDWDEHYEKNRTRELKRVEWVPIPNRMDGLGYLELVGHANGAAHFGAWIAIIEIASRCDKRGTLVRDGVPLTPQALAAITRMPAEIFEEVIPRLVNEIKWLEVIPQDDAGFPQDDAASRARVTGESKTRQDTERHGREARAVVTATAEPVPVKAPPHTPAPVVSIDEQWDEFRKHGEGYGMQCSEIEWQECRRFEWQKLDFMQRSAAIAGIRERTDADDRSLLQVVPKNYLRRRMWERRVKAESSGNSPPVVTTESKTRQSALDHLRRKGGTLANAS